MSATVSIAQLDIFTAVRAFLLTLISCEVIDGLDNGVAMPVAPFIAITALYSSRLSTNIHAYADPTPTTGTESIESHKEYVIQIDCYGPQSSEWAEIISTLWRDAYACDALGPVVQPLHADDPKMMPVVDGESNFEQRWMVEAHLQYNPVVQVPMQFFTAVVVNLKEVA